MTTKLYQGLIVLALFTLISCYPNGAQYTEELDLVYTNYDNGFDFKSKHTYAMPDSVVKISSGDFSDPDGNGKPDFVSATYSAVILAAIKANMLAAGWTLVNKNASPDVILLPTTMVTTNIYYYYDWWYWSWWYPGYYPGWGWYYPGSYYPAYVTGYRSGSVFVQMVDAKALSPGTDNAKIVWNCILNGLAEGDATAITTRIQNGFTQAFTQSPYLKH